MAPIVGAIIRPLDVGFTYSDKLYLVGLAISPGPGVASQ